MAATVSVRKSTRKRAAKPQLNVAATHETVRGSAAAGAIPARSALTSGLVLPLNPDAKDDPGNLSVAALLSSLPKFYDGKRVRAETRRFAAQLLRIMLGKAELDVSPKDARFQDPAWTRDPVFRRLAQTYMAFCASVKEAQVKTLDGPDRERAQLMSELITSTLSPTNLLFTNPVALRLARETRGRSLLQGGKNFINDLIHNRGLPSQVDRRPFKVGENLATTPGAVVFRNEMLELLQYQPATPEVHARPLLVIPPQINKFYFLDLAPGRSFVEYALSQKVQTFVISWRNPGPEQRHWNLDDYCRAVLEAMDAVRDITGSEDLNTFGFCAGGITMSVVLSYLAAVGDRRVHSASYAVTLIDFSVTTLVSALHSRPLIGTAIERSRKTGVYDGRELAQVFTIFRPNDLIWNYWVNNYLLGKTPPAFDILAWNNDSSNLSAALHEDFLTIFRENALPRPGAWRALGQPVDLTKITTDCFLTGAINDHLTPWKACYKSTQLLGGNCTFALSSAGHVASLVNPPGNPKATYWAGPEAVADPDAWFKAATQHRGSWWEYWAGWIGPRSGELRRAPRQLGNKRFPTLGSAPGTYVY